MADQLIQLERGEPRFRHDVKPSRDHRYAGSFVAVSGGKAEVNDVWLSFNTIVIRNGNDGPDYAAFPRDTIERFADMYAESGDQNKLFSEFVFALEMIKARRMYRAPRWGRRATASGSTLLGQVYNEDYTGVTSYFLFDREITEAEIRTWHPETYCQHEHDCCGHWYYNRAKLRRLPNGCTIVRQRGYVNI